MPYSAHQMYSLVNDVDAYPQFLPWCSNSHVLEKSEHRMKASLTLKAGKIKQSFTTENSMRPDELIEVHLLEGPFKHLNGSWHFEAISDTECNIALDMTFQFKNRILKMALESVFQKIIDTLVDSFTDRARQLYG